MIGNSSLVISRKQHVHFLHIGKTGGTAIKTALAGYETYSDDYILHLHPHATQLRDLPKGEKFIFFLRDPISRFISGFYSRQRQGQPRYFFPWRQAEKSAFEHFSTPNQLAIALSSENLIERKKAVMAMTNIQHVRDSYWRWFENKKYFITRLPDIFFFGHQESLSEDFDALKAKLCLPEFLKLPDNDLGAHRSPGNPDTRMEAKAIANLESWYKDDYEFLDLCNKVG